MNQATLIHAVLTRLKLDLPEKNPSECKIRCYLMPEGAERTECLDDCEAEAAVSAVAAKLSVELFESFVDVIWAGGDIDPLPLEKAVRARFAHGSQVAVGR